MDLRRVNQLSSPPLHCPGVPGGRNWACRWHACLVVWAVYIVKIKFRTGWFLNYVSANTQARTKGSVLAPCVKLVLRAVGSCIVKGQRYIFYHEASPKNLDLFCK